MEVALLVAAFAAGFVDAVVGGGGLIQLPALVLGLPGASPAQLLATNKLASFMGTSVSALTYRARRVASLREVPTLVACAFGGSLVGASLARFISRDAFEPLVLIAVVVVFALVWWRPTLGVDADPEAETRPVVRLASAGALGLAVGFYDGALGPGTGTFFVLGVVVLLGTDFVSATAASRWANWATNLAALVIFIPTGAVLWGLGLAMGLANVAGAYCGARMTLARGAGFVRVFLLVVVGVLAVRLSWDILA